MLCNVVEICHVKEHIPQVLPLSVLPPSMQWRSHRSQYVM